MGHFHQLNAGDGSQQLPGLFEDAVDPSQIAGIVECHGRAQFLLHLGLEVRQPLGQKLGVVANRVGDAQLRIFIAQRVVGMWIGGHDFTEPVLGEGLPVLGGQHLEESPLAGHALGITVALLFRPQDAKIDAQRLQDPGEGASGVLNPRMIGGVVAHEPQHIHRPIGPGHDRDLCLEVLGPVRPLARRLAERVPVALRALQRLL